MISARHPILLPYAIDQYVLRALPLSFPGLGVSANFVYKAGEGITLPSTWGFPDPLWDARAALPNVAFVTRMFVPVLVRFPHEEETDQPRIYSFPMHIAALLLRKITGVPLVPPSPDAFDNEADFAEARAEYEKRESDWIEEPVDIQDLETGVDFELFRLGSLKTLKYEVRFCPPSPALPHEDDREELSRELRGFDPADYIPAFNRRRYEAFLSRVMGAQR